MLRRPPRSPLFPYPTLFRSRPPGAAQAVLLEVRQVAARLRVPRREPAGILGAERLSHARRSVERRAVFRPGDAGDAADARRSEEHTSELQSRLHLVCRLLLE